MVLSCLWGVVVLIQPCDRNGGTSQHDIGSHMPVTCQSSQSSLIYRKYSKLFFVVVVLFLPLTGRVAYSRSPATQQIFEHNF